MPHRKFPKGIITLLISLIVMAVAASVASAGMQVHTQPVQTLGKTQLDAAPYAYAPQALNDAFTIRTETVLSWGLSMSDGEPLWLAGVSETATGLPSTLGLAWVPEPSWWGVSWVLQLRSDVGLLTPIDSVRDSAEAVLIQFPRPIMYMKPTSAITRLQATYRYVLPTSTTVKSCIRAFLAPSP